MQRMQMTAVICGWNTSGEPSDFATRMIGDLERFDVVAE
jgi:hypothetical protein